MKQIIFVVALVIIIPFSTLGLGGSILSPELQFPEKSTKETITKVLGCLRDDLTFVKGSFINEYSHQSFSGSATNVTKLIQLLQSSGFGFTVQFSDLKNDSITLSISQNTRQKETLLTINTAKKDFVFSDLKIQFSASKTEDAPSARNN